MRSIEQITQDIMALPSDSRALLADKIVESLEFDVDPGIQQAWLSVAKNRRNEIRNGEITPINGDDALAQVRKLLE
jgi:Putative addiction module component